MFGHKVHVPYKYHFCFSLRQLRETITEANENIDTANGYIEEISNGIKEHWEQEAKKEAEKSKKADSFLGSMFNKVTKTISDTVANSITSVQDAEKLFEKHVVEMGDKLGNIKTIGETAMANLHIQEGRGVDPDEGVEDESATGGAMDTPFGPDDDKEEEEVKGEDDDGELAGK